MDYRNLLPEVKIFFSSVKKKRYRLGLNPNHDWTIALTVTMVLNVIMVLFSIYYYSVMAKSSSIEEVENIANQKIDIFNEKLLEQVTDRFEGNKIESKRIVDNPVVVADPSE